MPKKAGDELSGDLLAQGYWLALGSSLSVQEMDALTKMVLERCKWFPTVAECREIMGEQSFSNPFYRASETARLERLGYGKSPELPKPERWTPTVEDIEAIKREVAENPQT